LSLPTGYVLKVHEFHGMLRGPEDLQRGAVLAGFRGGGRGDRGDDGHRFYQCVIREADAGHDDFV